MINVQSLGQGYGWKICHDEGDMTRLNDSDLSIKWVISSAIAGYPQLTLL